MTTYRRKEETQVWHWCANCSKYPSGQDVVTRHSKPEYGEMCTECRAKEGAGDCREDSFFAVRK